MKSIRANFTRHYKEPLSSFIGFSRAVQGGKYSKERISRNFKELVDPDDYAQNEKGSLIRHLDHLSNSAEAYGKRPKN